MANTGAILFEFDRERFERAPEILSDIIEARLDKLGRDIVTWIFEHAPKDTTVNAEAVSHLVEPIGRGAFQLIIFSDVPGARFALETGRRPGRRPPFNKILGWTRRRGSSPTERGRAETVGRRVGSSYRARRVPDASLLAALSGGGSATKAQRREAYRISTKIARAGTKAPRVFTRALQETRDLQLQAIRQIEQDATRFI